MIGEAGYKAAIDVYLGHSCDPDIKTCFMSKKTYAILTRAIVTRAIDSCINNSQILNDNVDLRVEIYQNEKACL